VRQAGADDDDRQARLAQLVAGRAERRDVVGTEVLHLVDEDTDALADVGGQSPDVGEELDEVDLDVAGVGSPPHGWHVDAGAPLVLQLRRRAGVAVREGLDDAQHVVDRLLVAMAELAHRLVQGAAQRPAQSLAGPRLELAGAPALAYGGPAQRVEQHRLADPAQSGEHEAALGTTLGDPLEDDVEGGQLLVTTGELGRALARARGVRIANRVHDRRVSVTLGSGLDCPIVCESESPGTRGMPHRLSLRGPPGRGRRRRRRPGPDAAWRSGRAPRRRAVVTSRVEEDRPGAGQLSLLGHVTW